MKIKIHPVFVMTTPVLILVSCAQCENGRPAAQTVAVQQSPAPASADAIAGRKLFLKNCAVCHAADAHGDEGPDLHNLDWTDQQIATRIRNGKKGAMTSFAGKLKKPDINSLIVYLRTLK